MQPLVSVEFRLSDAPVSAVLPDTGPDARSLPVVTTAADGDAGNGATTTAPVPVTLRRRAGDVDVTDASGTSTGAGAGTGVGAPSSRDLIATAMAAGPPPSRVITHVASRDATAAPPPDEPVQDEPFSFGYSGRHDHGALAPPPAGRTPHYDHLLACLIEAKDKVLEVTAQAAAQEKAWAAGGAPAEDTPAAKRTK